MAGGWGARLLALLPILLLIGVARPTSRRAARSPTWSARNPPPADEVEIRRVEFHPGEIRVLVRNPQPEDITVAVVTVDDAIVPFTTDGPDTIGRLRSTTIEIPYTWVEDDPYTVGVTSSSGIQTDRSRCRPRSRRRASTAGSVGGYALIGFLVGVVPVALGMLWLPSLRRADPRWLAAFMALTGGLLTFLAIDALFEALELQAALPGALGGPGLVLLGVAVSYLGLSWVAQRLSRRGAAAAASAPARGRWRSRRWSPSASACTTSARASRSARRSPSASSRSAASWSWASWSTTSPRASASRRRSPRAGGSRLRRLAGLALIAGAPAILGAWIGGFLTNEVLAVLFFSVAVGAAAQVVVEVGRYIAAARPRRPRARGGSSAGSSPASS